MLQSSRRFDDVLEATSDIKPREDERKVHADTALSKRSYDFMTSSLDYLTFCLRFANPTLKANIHDVTMT